jgi:hypothetical protein
VVAGRARPDNGSISFAHRQKPFLRNLSPLGRTHLTKIALKKKLWLVRSVETCELAAAEAAC